MNQDKYFCPVCGYFGLEELPLDTNGRYSFEICPCCGFEFGYDDGDQGDTYESYRHKWLKDNAKWFSKEEEPDNWNLETLIKQFNNLELDESSKILIENIIFD